MRHRVTGPFALDAHVFRPLQRKTLSEASFTPRRILQVGVQRKLAANLSACRSTGTDNMIPPVAKSLGGLAEDTVEVVRTIGRGFARRSGSSTASTISHLFGRIAIALWHGNASSWLHHHPFSPSLLIEFYDYDCAFFPFFSFIAIAIPFIHFLALPCFLYTLYRTPRRVAFGKGSVYARL